MDLAHEGHVYNTVHDGMDYHTNEKLDADEEKKVYTETRATCTEEQA